MAVEKHTGHDRYTGFVEHLQENGLGDMGFKSPHRVVFGSVAVIFLTGLVVPVSWVVVVLFPSLIKLASQSANDRFIPGIGEPQATRGQSAQMFVRTDNDDGLPHPLGLNGSCDGCGCAAINDDVIFRSGDFGTQDDEQAKAAKHQKLAMS